MEKIICKERQEKIKNDPLVTIITVCLNSEKFIKDTIESVLNQTYKNIEYIIIDGQSKDNTLNIIKEYEPKFEGRMKWITEPDKGIYDAMNKGIEKSNGEIIGIINSDDWYENNAVEIAVNTYKKINKEKIIIIGAFNSVRHNKEVIKPFYCEIDPNDAISFFSKNINHQAAFVTKIVYKTTGLFNPKYFVVGDRDFFYRASQVQQIEFFIFRKILSNARRGGISSEKGLKSIWLFTREKYMLQQGRIKLINNIYHCFKFFLIKSTKNILRRILGKNLMRMYYLKKLGYLP